MLPQMRSFARELYALADRYLDDPATQLSQRQLVVALLGVAFGLLRQSGHSWDEVRGTVVGAINSAKAYESDSAPARQRRN